VRGTGTLPPMRFRTVIEGSGSGPTGIPVPAEVVEGLGRGKRVKVVVSVGAHTYRSSVAPYDGRYMISLSAENRAKAGVAAGDEVDVDIEVDEAPREVAVPADFAAALEAHPAARKAFDALSFSNKQRHVLAIEGAKTPQTRQRRIDKAVDTLLSGS
jgi:hypothetical protein